MTQSHQKRDMSVSEQETIIMLKLREKRILSKQKKETNHVKNRHILSRR